MSDSNFLNVEEIILLSSCLFRSEGFLARSVRTTKSWCDFVSFVNNILNPNIYSILFGIEYYQGIIQKRNSKKNLVAATLFVDCLKGLLECSLYSCKYTPIKYKRIFLNVYQFMGF